MGQKLDHRIEILWIRGVWIKTQIGQRHGDQIAGAFQNGNTAVGKLGGVFRFEQDVQRGHIGIGDALFHHVHIERQACAEEADGGLGCGYVVVAH